MKRPPILRLSLDELVVDNFAGGGGASTGIGRALGRDPDIAINHDPEALAMHAANHPTTRHLCENVWDVDPAKVCAGRPVGVAWFSPDCTSPWPLDEVLTRLIAAAHHLLIDHNCDMHGHEGISAAAAGARDILNAVPMLRLRALSAEAPFAPGAPQR